jgi:ABC-type multidrug transport system fused ATPase/permease subunit
MFKLSRLELMRFLLFVGLLVAIFLAAPLLVGPLLMQMTVRGAVQWMVALTAGLALLGYMVSAAFSYLGTSAEVRASHIPTNREYSKSHSHLSETTAGGPSVDWRDPKNAERLQKIITETGTRTAGMPGIGRLLFEDAKLPAPVSIGPGQIADEQFIESRLRLQAAIEALEKRANFNLVSGLLITFSGLALLFYYVTHPAIADVGAVYFLETYLPRLTLVILIELFAFFFLRLYKASLSEVKYFENEITNIEMKRVALQAVLVAKNNDKLLTSIVDLLGKTERNHVLEKGQTTVDIETARLEHAMVTKLARDVASAVAGTAKKGKGKGLLDD